MPKHLEVILYVDDGWNPNSILKVICSKKTVKQYVLFLHDLDFKSDGITPDPAHYHVYLNFGNSNVQIIDVAKWFKVKSNLVERIHTNKYLTIRYYTHENDKEKTQYSRDRYISNFDVLAYLETKGKKYSAEKIIELCGDGTITRFNFPEFIDTVTYSKNEKYIKHAWEYYEHKLATNDYGLRQCQVIWLYGLSGVGKSTLCRMYAEKQNKSLYRSSGGNDPFSYYSGESIVVLDDIRPNDPFRFVELLKIIDPFNASAVHSRYKDVRLLCDTVMITSTLSPASFAKWYEVHKNEQTKQLYRRITEVWEVQTTKIEISQYLEKHGVFKVVDEINNPVPEYVKQCALPLEEKLYSIIVGVNDHGKGGGLDKD